MLFLVTEDILALRSREGEHPPRDQHEGAKQSDRGRPDRVGDDYRKTVDD
jgi:hypothetical protein